MRRPDLPALLPAALLLVLALAGACSREPAAPANPTAPAAGAMEADLARTLREQADFYTFRTPADLPDGLAWQDGAELPEFADPQARKGGTYTSFIADFPRTLRTIGPDATGGIRPFLLDYVEPRFIERHPNLPDAGYPGLTRQWAVDPARATTYYRIDPQARWSDGRPLTTDDVVFTFYFLRSPHLGQPWYNDFYTKNYRRLVVYDRLTFALEHPERKPDLATRLGNFTPYPRHAYADFGPGWIERFQWRVTPKLGAYDLRERDVEKGRAITLTRVRDWWAADKRFFRGRYNFDRFRLEVIRDPDKAVEAFARGNLDLIALGTPKHWYETLPETHPEVAAGRILRFQFFNRVPQPDWGLWINRAKPPLDLPEVRLGLQHATHFDLVCAQFFRGDAVRLQTRSDGYGWRMHPAITARAFDPVAARACFARAGFTRQGEDGVLADAAGRRLSFTITTGQQSLKDLLPILKQEALQAGVEFRLEVLDRTTGFKKTQEKNHELALVALSRSVELYPRYWEIYHGSNAYLDAYTRDGQPTPLATGSTPNPAPRQVRVQTNNMTMTFLPALDRLIEAYDRAETLDEVKRLGAEIEQIIHDDAAWINGWSTPFYRGAYWRHIRWPEGFNPMQSRNPEEFFVHWIDPEVRRETEEARRTGRTFPGGLQRFEQFRER